MADNITLETGEVVKSEDISGVQYPISKIYLGAANVNGGPVTTSNPLPVSFQNTTINSVVTNAGTFATQSAQSGSWSVGQSGTWTVQPGNTANTTAWLVTGTGGVFPASQSGAWNITNISGTISLPTGAATAAKQPALGIAGSAATDVLTIQGIASMTPLLVNGSGVTQPVSITGTPAVSISGTPSVSQSGTWTVQPGNTANTTAWLVTGTGGVFPASQSGTWTVTANAGTNLNTSALNLEATQADIKTSVQLIDDSVHSGDATVVKYLLIGAVLDDTSTGTVTENNANSLRMSSRRALLIEGVSGGTAVKVDGSAVTQPISGTVAFSNTTIAVTNAGTFATQSAQSGTWNITNISGTISLPTGAATAAKQPALGTAGSASTDVLTVQGIASMTALKVDGSAITQPISGSVTVSGTVAFSNTTIAVTNAGTFATQSAQSGTWNITNISGTISLPTGASTLAEQQTQTTSLQLIDDVVHAINGTFSKAAAIGGQLDDTSTTTATEDKIAPVRITINRGLHTAEPGTANFALAQVSVTSIATQIAAARTTRRTITIINHGSTDVIVGASGVTTTTGILLLGIKGAAITMQVTGAVYGIVASGSQTVSCVEEYD